MPVTTPDPQLPTPAMANAGDLSRSTAEPPTVRFASQNQEIDPQDSIYTSTASPGRKMPPNQESRPPILQEPQEELQDLAIKLEKSRFQETRMQHFAFEPVSLPPTRAPSRDSIRRNFRDGPSPPPSGSHSPVLGAHDADRTREKMVRGILHQPEMTPQSSLSNEASSKSDASRSPAAHGSRPSSSSGPISTKPSSTSDGNARPKESHRRPRFFLGPSEDSPPQSPRYEIGSSAVGSAATTPFGDQNDPYSRSKMPPPQTNLSQLDQRFIFGGLDSKRRPIKPHPGHAILPVSDKLHDKKLFGKKDARQEVDGYLEKPKPHGSMSELKRFFRMGAKQKRAESPASIHKKSSSRSSSKADPFRSHGPSVPFADDHGLQSKYGKLGRVLGSGAGGSVRLLKRNSDGVTFAVKQFRERYQWESEKDYAKKVTAEFCIGSTLHHGNIIETLDILHENSRWYEVMEFAPYDLFACVMTGKMTREEIACSFLQIVNGVTYLHSMGLAHRDLKLDNVVVNDRGIMKLIDFGSAFVFRYPFENNIVLASGVVGSDPYLAPEVYKEKGYDARATDIWSLAIIFCCMSLGRFPWKQPRTTDTSFNLFVSPPSPGTPFSDPAPRESATSQPTSTADSSHEADRGRSQTSRYSQGNGASSNPNPTLKPPQNCENIPPNHTPALSEQPTAAVKSTLPTSTNQAQSSAGAGSGSAKRHEVIKGPWRLLRLLPRDSRQIISRMLKVNPRERATLEEVLSDDWVRTREVCRQEESGQVINAPNHTHVLEPPSGTPPPAKNNNKK
ncbi:Nitrogen permease reactivator protein [Ophidiomyces ophidiicola]|nr:Nitrogen permease reactivator protein [Ophidiomyces ophidiicola]